MKNCRLFLIGVILTFNLSCNNSSQKNASESQTKNIESQLQEYLDALISGDINIIKKYFYQDTYTLFNKITGGVVSFDEYMFQSYKNVAQKAKDVYAREGVKHFYKIEKKVGQIKVRDFEIAGFLVNNTISKDNKIHSDTLRILSIIKNDKLEFICISDGSTLNYNIENILLYNFSLDETKEILNMALDGKYATFKNAENLSLLMKYEWKLEALGTTSDKLKPYHPNPELLSSGNDVDAIHLPENILPSDSLGGLLVRSIYGQNVERKISIDGNLLSIIIDGYSGNVDFKIYESGYDLFYLDITLYIDNSNLVLVYKGHELTGK